MILISEMILPYQIFLMVCPIPVHNGTQFLPSGILRLFDGCLTNFVFPGKIFAGVTLQISFFQISLGFEPKLFQFTQHFINQFIIQFTNLFYILIYQLSLSSADPTSQIPLHECIRATNYPRSIGR